MQSYPISILPIWITTSNHFKDYVELYPEETIFYCADDLMADAASISVESYDDIDRIIRADFKLGYSEETYIEIFKNVNEFWSENPNSAPVRLPEKETSWLGKQIRELLESEDRALIMNCMKLNYVELFKYKVQTDKHAIENAQSYSSVYNVLYYAVANNHIEILEAGLKAGCIFYMGSLLKISYEKKSLPITKLLFQYANSNYNVRFDTLNYAAENGTTEQLIYTIEWIKTNSQINNIQFDLKSAIKNIENFKYLFENNYFVILMPLELLEHAVVRGLSVENIKMIENLTGVSVKNIDIKNGYYRAPTDSFIFKGAILNNNIQLYNYLRENGFRITEEVLDYFDKRPLNFSKGLIKSHIKEDAK